MVTGLPSTGLAPLRLSIGQRRPQDFAAGLLVANWLVVELIGGVVPLQSELRGMVEAQSAGKMKPQMAGLWTTCVTTGNGYQKLATGRVLTTMPHLLDAGRAKLCFAASLPLSLQGFLTKSLHSMRSILMVMV